MLNPVCGDCGVEMLCHKNGVLVRIHYDVYVSGDQFKCPLCGWTVVTNYGKQHFQTTCPNPEPIIADLTPKG